MSEDDVEAPAVGELFGLLGDDRRMRILWALWETFDFGAYVTESRDATSFGTLRERAGIDDPGNFNYHLGKLADVLVEGREDGYVLTPLGYNLMRAVDEYAAFEYETREEWVTADPCPFCGGDLVAEYRREVLSVRCRDCRGIAEDGNLTFVQLGATGTERLDAEDLLDAAAIAMLSKIRSSLHGVCWNCRAPMTHSFELCSDHERTPGGVCEACSLRFRTQVDADCENCGTNGRGPLLEYVVVSPIAGAAFAAVGEGPSQVGAWAYRLAVLGAATERVVGTDPVRVRVDLAVGDERRHVTVEDRPSGVAVVGDRAERASPVQDE